jgi:membrane fusion protein
MSHDLFRPEVLQARRQAWLGGIALSQPPGLRWLTALAVLAAAAVVATLWLGEYTRRSTVSGQLVPDLGLSTVLAPTHGVAARLFPEEGERVVAGQPLTLINVPRITAAGGDVRVLVREGIAERRQSLSQLGQSQAELLQAQRVGQLRQRKALVQELDQLRQEVATRREQVRIGQEVTARYERIASQQYISQLQVNQHKQSVLELLQAQQSLERQATTLARTIVQIDQSLDELPAQRRALEAGTRRDLAELDIEGVQQEANGDLLLRSPVSGLVTSRLIEPGQAVQAGQALMTLLPAGSQLQAQLLVPSRAVGFIAPGDRVLLRYQAFPYQKFGHQAGRVLRISRSAIAPGNGAPPGAEPYYRVLVALDRQTVTAFGKAEPMRPGMLLEADILGERRRLYEWLLEPLYSLRGRAAS